MHLNWYLRLPLIAAVVFIGGCNSGGGSASTGSGTMSLAVADTPVDGATHVNVTFAGVELHGTSGTTTDINFPTPKTIDLLTTSSGNAATLLSGQSIPAGDYQWIRLMVDTSQSTITLNSGGVYPLTIPSGSASGLKLVSGFTVAAGNQADFTIDFDLRKAITLANGTYSLTPALRLLNSQQVGQIAGSAPSSFAIGSTSITSSGCSPAVYVYSGSNVTPVDINTTSSVQPVTTASLTLDNATGSYDYKAAFLAPGSYTVAMTCAANDNPNTADTLTFSTAKNATVTANTTTTVNFP